MSDADQKRSNGGGDDDNGGGISQKTDRKKRGENVGENSTNRKEKGDRVSLFRFRKLRRKNKLPTSSSSSSSSCCCFLGKRENVGGCFMCLTKSPTVDSHVLSRETDPNSPGFTFELTRSMIEKNDFYSKECNTHLDVGATSKSSVGMKNTLFR